MALRRAAGGFVNVGLRCIGSSARALAQEGQGSQSQGSTDFWEAWRRHNTNLSEPMTFSKMAKAPERPEKTPEKVTLNLYVPHETLAEGDQVSMVGVPASTGDFGVMPGHIPTVAQLRPGVLTVQREEGQSPEKYFVSSGFAFVHPDSSADISAVECVPLEQLDAEAAKRNQQSYEEKAAAAADDYERAAAQIGAQVCSELTRALQG